MPVTVATLRGLATSALGGAGESLGRASAEIGSAADGFASGVLGPLGSGQAWADGGQQQALAKLSQLHRQVGELPGTIWTAAGAVRDWSDGLAGVQSKLRQLESIAAEHGLRIGDGGVVTGTSGDGDLAAELQTRLDGLLAEATEVDDGCARKLAALLYEPRDGGSLAELAGQSVLSPLIHPMKTSGGGGGTAAGPRLPTPPSGGGLGNFFRRLFRPNGPWPRPVRSGHGWTGSGKTTAQLKASGEAHFSGKGKNELTRAGRTLDKHNSERRKGHDKFPAARGDGPTRSKTAQEEVVEKILDDPRTREVPATTKKANMRGGYYYIAPDGRGLAYNKHGVLQYFGMFKYPR